MKKTFVSEKRNVNNLLYVRELLKLELDDWVQSRKEGKLEDDDLEIVMDVISDLSIVDESISNLYTKIVTLEEFQHE